MIIETRSKSGFLSGNRVRIGATLGLFLLMVIFLGQRTATHLRSPDDASRHMWGLMDFQDVTYYPVVAFLGGDNPYDTGEYRSRYPASDDFPLYSPLTLLVHLPFGLLPFGLANLTFFVYNVALLVLFSRLVLKICGLAAEWHQVFGMCFLILLTRPGHNTILGGQIILEVSIGVAVALHYSKNRPWVAGMGLALASLKPTFGVPLAILMLFRKDIAAVGRGVIIGVSGGLLAILFISKGLRGFGTFLKTILTQHIFPGSTPGIPDPTYFMRIDTLSLAARIFSWNPNPVWAAVFFVSLLAVAGVLIACLNRSEVGVGGQSLSSAVAIFCMLACVYHMSYDALILVLPLTAAITARIEPWSKIVWSFKSVFSICCSVILFNVYMTNFGQRFLVERGVPSSWPGIINALSLLLGMTLIGLFVLSGSYDQYFKLKFQKHDSVQNGGRKQR